MDLEPLNLPELIGNRVHLRGWRPADIATVQEASQDSLIPLITTVPATAGEAEARAFIERQHGRMKTRLGYAFAIADGEDRAIGHINMFFSTGSGARASLGYWIAPSQRRNGYAADALSTLTSWARHHDDLDRLELYVEPWNEGSWRAAEQAGYAREGLLRAWERIDGKPRDMFMYAQLTAKALAEMRPERLGEASHEPPDQS
ncbi:GNAT family N-acetyltransferase [Curtobacterium sp. Leaf183]|uniref:GNAT family N-acetyltransferase n=1 Tax=Curtobacterium sp. Leaf183 TaxID=1736291 RepID=UPI0009E864A1|nr:GNAT family N-acetyltransferase [Curtobacterium sp. Leaf183]